MPTNITAQTTEYDLMARRTRLLGPAYRLFYEEPVHPVRGCGTWLYDASGVAYLDAYNNVPCVGHCHPHVVEAIAKQAGILNTHTRYLDNTVVNYAEKLLATFPSELSQAMFTCTGSEANDLALRIATAATGGTGVIVTRFAYHGVTSALAQLSPSLGSATQLGAHVRTVPAPDVYRSAGANESKAFIQHITQAIDDMQASGIKPAALLVDTIFSSDGVFPEPQGCLAAAAEIMHNVGGLFIADEVQAGMGRTGKQMWGFQRHDVIPDIVTMGKPMGNGHPLAGIAVKPNLLKKFGEMTRYFNTFGGNPVSCAAGIAVLEVIERESLMTNAQIVGAYMMRRFQELAQKYPIIGDVRGAGLFMGVDLVQDQTTRLPATEKAFRVVNEMRRKHVLISTSGPNGNILKIRPPLVFSTENADTLLSVMDDVLGALPTA